MSREEHPRFFVGMAWAAVPSLFFWAAVGCAVWAAFGGSFR